MGSLSIWHWIVVVVKAIVILLPIAKILRRAAFSGVWCILALVPLANLIGLWVLAVAPCPHSKRTAGFQTDSLSQGANSDRVYRAGLLHNRSLAWA